MIFPPEQRMFSTTLTTSVTFILYGYLHIGLSTSKSQPCVFTGKILSKDSWFGFLANVTFAQSGRLIYRFVYPADTCCAKVLFYDQDQVAKIHDRMNCFQKVSILRDDSDFVLQLTPRFTWSGCHMIHKKGVSYYECEGGRSFIANEAISKSSWFIAISNCAAIHGIDIDFHLEVLGGVKECHGRYKFFSTTTSNHLPAAGTAQPAYRVGTEASNPTVEEKCTVEGNLNTTKSYYAYFSNISLKSHGRIVYKFTYPSDRVRENVIIFKKENLNAITSKMSCFDYQGIIPAEDVEQQLITMSKSATWVGCKTDQNSVLGHVIVCTGERKFGTATELYLAASNCWSKNGIYLNYKIDVYGDTGRTCAGTILVTTNLCSLCIITLFLTFWNFFR